MVRQIGNTILTSLVIMALSGLTAFTVMAQTICTRDQLVVLVSDSVVRKYSDSAMQNPIPAADGSDSTANEFAVYVVVECNGNGVKIYEEGTSPEGAFYVNEMYPVLYHPATASQSQPTASATPQPERFEPSYDPCLLLGLNVMFKSLNQEGTVPAFATEDLRDPDNNPYNNATIEVGDVYEVLGCRVNGAIAVAALGSTSYAWTHYRYVSGVEGYLPG